MIKRDDKSLCMMKTSKITIVILVRPESDYILKNEIERLKFDQSEHKTVKTSLSSLVKISIFHL